ncbi:hypothetical protein LP416_16035 [Polaromonas sp. P2-4]|nr:hypothetical protein LP416_16035 [Polaromonas sp. P2-4]
MIAHNFVLVHGAWHGGWCWRRVAQALQLDHHKVYPVTLTGLGRTRPPAVARHQPGYAHQ